MPYLTIDELEALGLNAKALSTFSDPVKKGAIDNAVDEAEGYLRRAVAVPLDPAPLAVKTHIARIAVYNLMSVRGMDPERDRIIIDNYNRAIAYFTGIAKGTVELPPGVSLPPADNPADDLDQPTVWSGEDRGFGGNTV